MADSDADDDNDQDAVPFAPIVVNAFFGMGIGLTLMLFAAIAWKVRQVLTAR